MSLPSIDEVVLKLSRHVMCAIDDAEAQKFDAALLHACFTIDRTGARLFPEYKDNVRARYVRCIREYYWIIEPMLGGGVVLKDLIFTNIKIKGKSPDFAEVVYLAFRNAHAHAVEVQSEFEVIPSTENTSRWVLEKGHLHIPDRVIWGLLAIAVFSKANASEKLEGDYYLSLGNERFRICDWWGREDDFRAIASKYNQVKVRLENLGDWPATPPSGVRETAFLVVRQPPVGD